MSRCCSAISFTSLACKFEQKIRQSILVSRSCGESCRLVLSAQPNNTQFPSASRTFSVSSAFGNTQAPLDGHVTAADHRLSRVAPSVFRGFVSLVEQRSEDDGDDVEETGGGAAGRRFVSNRRRRRRKARERGEEEVDGEGGAGSKKTGDGDDGDDEEESDSLHKIVWGVEKPDREDYVASGGQYPRTFAEWRRRLPKAWMLYKSSFDGLLWKDPKEELRDKGGGKDTDDNEYDIDFHMDLEEIQRRQKKLQKDIADNVGRNLNTLEKEGKYVAEMAKEQTGIYNTEDLKLWATEQIKLATECLQEFMKGYRAGRDDEVEKMLNLYFKEFDEVKAKKEDSKDVVAGAESNEIVGPDVEEQDSEDQSRGGRRGRRKRKKNKLRSD